MDPITAEILADMQRTAELVLTQKQQVLEYDKKRQANREAITALKKVVPQKNTPPTVSSSKKAPSEKETWILLGNCFIQLPTTQVLDILTEEQSHIEKELEKTNSELKTNVEQLLLMEGLQDDYSGFNLKSFVHN